MGTKLIFRDYRISLFDDKTKYFPVNIDGLHNWFKSHSLSEIKEFPSWLYSINGIDNHFIIKRGDDFNWKVYKLEKQDEVYFSFDCTEALKFLHNFELNLRIKIKEGYIDLFSLPRMIIL